MKRLQARHEPDVAEFCRRCSAFFSLVTGESAPVETARVVLEGRPAEVAPQRKHVIGIERQGVLVAIVDLLEGYPRENEWYVGLLLLLPEERSRGLGKAVWDAMETWMRSAGARLVRLIVQQQNPDAARFWKAVGFSVDGQVHQVLAGRTNLCWQFAKQLDGPTP